MLVTIEKAKKFLRIELDFTEEDEIVNGFIKAAEEMIYNMTGKRFDSSNELAVTTCLFLVRDLYENNSLTAKEDQKLSSIANMMIGQLAMSYDTQ